MGNTFERVVTCNSHEVGGEQPLKTDSLISTSVHSTQSLDSRLRSDTTLSEIGSLPGILQGAPLVSHSPIARGFPGTTRPRAVTVDERVNRSLDDRLNLTTTLPLPGGIGHHNARPSISQRLSRFTSGLFEAVIIVQTQKKALIAEGMTSSNFAVGVINALVTAVIVGGAPEYYVVYYALQALILLAIRTYTWWQAKLQFYLLDFCWVTNYLLCLIGLFVLVDQLLYPALFAGSLPPWQPLPEVVTRLGWPLIFTVSTGPLTWAVAATGNALVFHSFEHTASMFIHASPMLAAYCLRWNGDALDQSFPGLLGAPGREDADALTELFLPALGFYGVWWLLYTTWLVADGVSRPERGYDTVFNSFAPIVMEQLGISSRRCAAFSYMQVHALACTLTFAIATLAYHSFYFHTLLVVAMLLSAVLSGAKLYSFLMLDAYEEKLREQLHSSKAAAAAKGGGAMDLV